jgi:hypothetical protein
LLLRLCVPVPRLVEELRDRAHPGGIIGNGGWVGLLSRRASAGAVKYVRDVTAVGQGPKAMIGDQPTSRLLKERVFRTAMMGKDIVFSFVSCAAAVWSVGFGCHGPLHHRIARTAGAPRLRGSRLEQLGDAQHGVYPNGERRDTAHIKALELTPPRPPRS